MTATETPAPIGIEPRVVNTTKFGCRHTTAKRYFLTNVPQTDSYLQGMTGPYKKKSSAENGRECVLRHLGRTA